MSEDRKVYVPELQVSHHEYAGYQDDWSGW